MLPTAKLLSLRLQLQLNKFDSDCSVNLLFAIVIAVV